MLTSSTRCGKRRPRCSGYPDGLATRAGCAMHGNHHLQPRSTAPPPLHRSTTSLPYLQRPHQGHTPRLPGLLDDRTASARQMHGPRHHDSRARAAAQARPRVGKGNWPVAFHMEKAGKWLAGGGSARHTSIGRSWAS